MNRVIVTGATGAIGTSLIKELIKRNVEVLVFTRKNSKRNNNIPKNNLVSIKYCSLSDIKNIDNNTQKQYDVFFHLAWAGTTGEGRNDKDLQAKNVEYALDAIKCAKKFGCKKFVGIGSQAEYGRVMSALTPTTECNPESEYGKAKLQAGIKTRELASSLGLQHNWIRVLSVYGPNDGENSLISYTINKCLLNEELELTKCEQVWDYLFSEDAAEAIYKIAESGVNNKTYVLGSGETKKLKEFVYLIKNICNSNSKLLFGAKPYNDKQVMYLKADISDLKKDTKWSPKTNFEEGIKIIVGV